MTSSPSVAIAMTRPPLDLASLMLLIIFSYNGPRGIRVTIGMSSSMSEIGPCFISPPA